MVITLWARGKKKKDDESEESDKEEIKEFKRRQSKKTRSNWGGRIAYKKKLTDEMRKANKKAAHKAWLNSDAPKAVRERARA